MSEEMDQVPEMRSTSADHKLDENEAIEHTGNTNTIVFGFGEETEDGATEEYNHEMNRMMEIRRTFSSVLRDFEGDSSLERFIDEYKKLYGALIDSHKMQRKFMQECSHLRCEIKNNAEKVHMAIHLSQEDKEIIHNLTRQVNQAWNEVEVLSIKENRARSVIAKLKEEINSLTTLVEAGTGVQEIETIATQAVIERKELEQALLALKEDIEFKDFKVHELTDRMVAKDENAHKEMKKLREELQVYEKKKEDVEEKLDETVNHVNLLERVRANMTTENMNLARDLDICKTRLAKMEKEDIDNKAEVAKLTNLYNELMDVSIERLKEITKLSNDNDILKKRNKTLQNLNHVQKEKIDEKDHDIETKSKIMKKKEAEIETLVKKSEHTSTKLRTVQHQMTERGNEMKIEQEEIHRLFLELNDAHTKLKKSKEEINKLMKSSEKDHEMYFKLNMSKQDLEKSLDLMRKTNKNLEKELNSISKTLSSAIDTTHNLESDKERLYGRINFILEMVDTLATDNDNKEAKLMKLLKVNNEQEVNITKTHSRLVHMTNERDHIRNALHLIELKNDDLSLANINFSKQSAALSQDLHHKEQELSKLNKHIDQLKAEIRSLRNERVTMREQARDYQNSVSDLEKMVFTMDKIICRKEQKMTDVLLANEKLLNQRNLLGYDCCRKKEQIHLLMEKNKLMQSIFTEGNRSYNHQNNLIDQLKLKITELYRDKMSLLRRVGNNVEMRSRLGLGNQQLVRALARCRAMEGQNPYNLHRWRHLKAVDISQYEMVIKIQHLLKRIIIKTDEVTRLESIVIDKATIVNEMKLMLGRRPGLEIVAKAKSEHKEKEKLERRLKAAVGERNMYTYRCDRQVIHNKTLLSNLLEEKTKAMQLQKANIKLKNKLAKLPKIVPSSSPSSSIKAS